MVLEDINFLEPKPMMSNGCTTKTQAYGNSQEGLVEVWI